MSSAVDGDDIADLLLWLTLRRRPTLGAARLLCVDGRAGSGKTSLARAVHALALSHGTSRLVSVDDLLDGWDGLGTVGATVRRDLLEPLSRGLPGRVRRYDWRSGRFRPAEPVEPTELVVLEGVGSGDSSYAGWITTLVWVEAPADLRRERALARDGDVFAPHWDRWADHEDALLARERTAERADVAVEVTGDAVAVTLR